MHTALRLNATVQPGHRIEITAPELPEGSHVDVIITQESAEPYRRYPSTLELEYDALIEKELHGALTEAEALRLQKVCHIFAEIDELTLQGDIRTQRLDQIEAQLADIRAEIERLPDD